MAVRALVFDVFGTLVDWRTGIARRLTQAAWKATRRSSPTTGASATCRSSPRSMASSGRGATSTSCISSRSTTCFASAGSMPPTRPGSGSWRHGMRSTPGPTSRTASSSCAAATSWRRSQMATWRCSSTSRATATCGLTACCRPSWLGAYKPDPAVYLSAARLLALDPGEVMLVAAHPWDLKGARAAGLRSALLRRPLEYGPNSPRRAMTRTPTTWSTICRSSRRA